MLPLIIHYKRLTTYTAYRNIFIDHINVVLYSPLPGLEIIFTISLYTNNTSHMNIFPLRLGNRKYENTCTSIFVLLTIFSHVYRFSPSLDLSFRFADFVTTWMYYF